VNRWNNGLLRLGMAWLLMAVAAVGYAEPQVSSAPRVLTVGVVPQFDVRQIHAVWRPILDELERRTGFAFVLRGASTIPSFERDLAVGEFDLAYINPYHAVTVSGRHYTPLVRDVGTDLHGILVVPRQSPIQSVQELEGRTVAFPAPMALGATLLMRAELLDRYGVEVVPRYVQSHSSVYLNVALGETVAGGGVQKTLAQQPHELQSSLRVVYRTQTVPSHPVVVHNRIPPEIRDRLLQALLALGREPGGRELLSGVPIAALGPASVEEYRFLRELGLKRFQ
jgi:phosphonate transport system substrate-binding protein